jgi:hypothetical protein
MPSVVPRHSGGGIRTRDLRVMSPKPTEGFEPSTPLYEGDLGPGTEGT